MHIYIYIYIYIYSFILFHIFIYINMYVQCIELILINQLDIRKYFMFIIRILYIKNTL